MNDSFATKLSFMFDDHKPECLVKRLDCGVDALNSIWPVVNYGLVLCPQSWIWVVQLWTLFVYNVWNTLICSKHVNFSTWRIESFKVMSFRFKELQAVKRGVASATWVLLCFSERGGDDQVLPVCGHVHLTQLPVLCPLLAPLPRQRCDGGRGWLIRVWYSTDLLQPLPPLPWQAHVSLHAGQSTVCVRVCVCVCVCV